jgi:leucyl/phenylalanyl-tRNA--protein transferase
MAVLQFPPIHSADENGLLALGGDLDVSSLVLAYRSGIFPWPISEEFPLAWFSPDPRGLIDFKDVIINKRLIRYLKNSPYQFTCNQDFKGVIQACSVVPRNHQSGTWITDEVIAGYCALFDKKYAYSIEAWRDNKLVAGIYGVCITGIVSGESMFHSESNASKQCLIGLISLLKLSGVTWLDTQMVTPVIRSLGGKEILRKEFLARLRKCPLKSREEIFPASFDLFKTFERSELGER